MTLGFTNAFSQIAPKEKNDKKKKEKNILNTYPSKQNIETLSIKTSSSVQTPTSSVPSPITTRAELAEILLRMEALEKKIESITKS